MSRSTATVVCPISSTKEGFRWRRRTLLPGTIPRAESFSRRFFRARRDEDDPHGGPRDARQAHDEGAESRPDRSPVTPLSEFARPCRQAGGLAEERCIRLSTRAGKGYASNWQQRPGASSRRTVVQQHSASGDRRMIPRARSLPLFVRWISAPEASIILPRPTPQERSGPGSSPERSTRAVPRRSSRASEKLEDPSCRASGHFPDPSRKGPSRSSPLRIGHGKEYPHRGQQTRVPSLSLEVAAANRAVELTAA